MADNAQKPAGKGKPNMLFWGILVVVIILGCAAGFGVGRLMAGPKSAQAAQEAPESAAPSAPAPQDLDYIDLDAITVNLDEPRLGRYVRAGVTLAVKKSNAAAVNELLGTRKPEIKSMLNVYFAGCSLEQVRGAQNLNRLRRELGDKLNERLWPDGKPMIEQVLFKDFAVQ